MTAKITTTHATETKHVRLVTWMSVAIAAVITVILAQPSWLQIGKTVILGGIVTIVYSSGCGLTGLWSEPKALRVLIVASIIAILGSLFTVLQ